MKGAIINHTLFFCLFMYSTVVPVEIFRYSVVVSWKGTFLILACKLDTIIAVFHKAFAVFFATKSSANR